MSKLMITTPDSARRPAPRARLLRAGWLVIGLALVQGGISGAIALGAGPGDPALPATPNLSPNANPGPGGAASAAVPDPASAGAARPANTQITGTDGPPTEEPEIKAKPVRRHRRSRLTSDESEAASDHRSLVLTTGEDKTVDLDFDANTSVNGISIGNPLVVATTLVRVGEKRQIVFKPLKSGETTVTVRDNDGTIRLIFHVRVVANNLLHIAGDLRSMLRDVEGIDIRIVGSKIVIDGEVLVPADYGKLQTVINSDNLYKEIGVVNLVQLSPLAMQVIARKIQEDVKVFAPNVTCRVVNGVLFLEGSVDAEYKATRAANVASVYLYEYKPQGLAERDPAVHIFQNRRAIQNLIIIEPAPPKKQEKLVRVTVHFVELSKDYSKVFGFSWKPGFTPQSDQIALGAASNTATTTGPSFSATISNLFPRLASAQAAGFARVLRTGTIVVRSGQKAALDDQDDYPFVITGA